MDWIAVAAGTVGFGGVICMLGYALYRLCTDPPPVPDGPCLTYPSHHWHDDGYHVLYEKVGGCHESEREVTKYHCCRCGKVKYGPFIHQEGY